MATFSSNNYGGRVLTLTVTQSGEYLNWTFSSSGGSSTYYTIYSCYASINGTQIFNYGTVGWNTYAFPAAKGSTSGSVYIGGGSRNIYVSFHGKVYYAGDVDNGGNVWYTTQTRTVSIAHWSWGFNGEGNNDSKNAFHLGDTSFSVNNGATYTMNSSRGVTPPNGFYLQNTFGGSSVAGTWTTYTMPTNFTANADHGWEYDYSPYNYSITYTMNGGTNNSNNPSSYNVLYGVTFGNPTRDHYTFKNWTIGGTAVTGINSGANASFSSVDDMRNKCNSRTTGDKTVVANWTGNTYKISYNANGGSSTPSQQSVVYPGSATLASAISRNNAVSTANKTITISYNANNGSSTPTASTGTAVDTTTTTYTFNKWALGSTSGTQYAAGASYSPSSDVTMYATWSSSSSTARTSNPSITLAGAITRGNTTLSSYTVSYNANGGTTTPSSQTATKTRKYTFNKWNTNSSGTGTNYSAGTAYTFSANATLYAKWNSTDSGGSVTLPAAISKSSTAVAGYLVSYNTNGGSGAPTAQTSGNRTVTYTFDKWAAGSTTGTKYSASSSYTPSANTTMYATWISSTSANSSWTCSSTKPTRTGYTFLGWSTSSTATTATYEAGKTYIITEAKTLYAVWKINSYFVDVNGYLDGVNKDNIRDFGKCDVYINGNLDAQQVGDYNKTWPYGTTYEIKNITPDWGVKYNGVHSGSLSGTVGAADVKIWLSFTRLPVKLDVNVNGEWKKGTVWVNVDGVWKKARALHINQNNTWTRLEKVDYDA